jgi:hypothetical protein
MLKNILDKGYFSKEIKHSKDVLASFNIIKKFKLKNLNQRAGYSINIYDQLDNKIKTNIYSYIKKIVNKNKFIEKYIFLPKILKLEVLISSYIPSESKNPTRAMLWHRDADDIFSHIKIIMPLGITNKYNGMFSCLSRKVCHRLQYLKDEKFVRSLMDKSEFYKADQYRLSDETVRKKFSKEIFDFKSTGNDILFIDSNICYHKGGQILRRGYKRHLIIATIGGITHSFNPYFSESGLSFVKFFARIMKFYKKIKLNIEIKFKNKLINI